MPDRLAVAENSNGDAAFLDVRDDVHLRVLRQEGLAVGIGPRRIELAEEPAELEHLRIRQPLAAEADHEIVEPGFAYGRERIGCDWPRHLDAAHFNSQRLAESID